MKYFTHPKQISTHLIVCTRCVGDIAVIHKIMVFHQGQESCRLSLSYTVFSNLKKNSLSLSQLTVEFSPLVTFYCRILSPCPILLQNSLPLSHFTVEFSFLVPFYCRILSPCLILLQNSLSLSHFFVEFSPPCRILLYNSLLLSEFTVESLSLVQFYCGNLSLLRANIEKYVQSFKALIH